MILKRFETDNNHIDYKKVKIKEKDTQINESNDIILETKLDLLANISKNWNDELKNDYYTIRSLYKMTLEELKSIRSKYILNETINDETINEGNEINDTKLFDTVAELIEKYGNHDAVKEIRIDEGKIVFDILCETDIQQSVTEYNGFDLTYNKVCEIPINENNNNIDNKDEEEINEEVLIKQSLIMSKTFLDFI